MKKCITAIALVAVASGCAFEDGEMGAVETAAVAEQASMLKKRASVAYPIQVEQERDGSGQYPIRRDPRTSLPLSGWDGHHAELLVADEYAQCVSEIAGTDLDFELAQPGLYPSMADWSYALGRVAMAMDQNPCPLDEYDDSSGSVAYPPSQLEWAHRRQSPLCNMDADGNLKQALVLSPYNSNTPLASLVDWMGQQTSFAITPANSRLFLQSSAYKMIYYGEIGLCLAQRLNSLLEGVDTLTLTTREQMLLRGLTYESAQIALLKSAYVLQLHEKAQDVSQVPSSNVNGYATGAYLWHWMNDRPQMVGSVANTFVRALRLTAGAGTQFAGFLERQAGARWTTGNSSDPFLRDWGGGSARSRLMNLIYGGNALSDLWGSADWVGNWFSEVTHQSSDPRVSILLNLARQADALLLRHGTAGYTVDPISAEEIYLETEVALRMRYCLGGANACSSSTIRASLPSLSDSSAFILARQYGVKLEHAQRLAAGLYDSVVANDMRCNNGWPCTTASGKGPFHITGMHELIIRTDHLGQSSEWIKLDRNGVLLSGDYSDKVDWGLGIRTPFVLDWNTTMTVADPVPHEAYENVGIVSALAYARETLFALDSNGDSPLDSSSTAEVHRELERLLGKTTVMHRPTSTVVLMPAAEPEPTLVTLSSTTGAGATVKPAAMIDGYSSPGGISRAGLDAQADSTFAERTTGANASAHLKRLVWYPGTPGFVGLWPGMSSYLLRHTSNGQRSYTYVATVGPGQRDMSTRGNTIVSTGWFADLERRITAVQPIDWSRPRYDGFGLPSNWVPPADASLMGGAAGEESYQYLLRSAKSAAEEATAAVKTAIDKLVEEAQDGAALQQAETKAQAIGKLEQKALCGDTEACTLPMATVRFEHEDVDEICSGIPAEGQASCRLALWRANDALRTNWIPEVVANRLKYTSETYSDPEYEGSELQRVLVRIWNASRLLNATRDKSRAEAQDYGREYAAVEAAKASATSEYEAALAELEALDDAIVTSDPTKKKQIEALEFSVKAAEERVQTAGVYVNQYCEGDVDRKCTYDCSNLRTHCTEDKCTKTYLTVDPKSIYDACKDDKLEQCGHGATEGFGSSPNNLPCRDALLGYQGALTNQTEVGKNTDAQLAVITDGDPNLELKQKSVAAKRTAALERKQAALAELGARKSSAWTQVLSQYGVMRQIKGELQSALAELEQLQLRAVQSDSRAKLEVSASASMIENNANLRRRYRSYDLWRAEALLESARRLAVAARRAIESRFVVDLSTLDSQQAFVASPSAWADEIYESDLNAPEVVGLSQSSENGDAIYPNKLIDYVENLERFVQGYTITYPTPRRSTKVPMVCS